MTRRLVLTLLAGLLLSWPANATWSIVVVNRRTGEVAIGSATCLARINLTKGLPVIVVGKGAGAIQAQSGGEAGLVIMFKMLKMDADPQTILTAVKMADPRPASRQIGISGMTGSPVTFTGAGARPFKGGVIGEVGDLAYAIQGNVLANQDVWLDAEAALLGTPGDVATKLMAAMEAARAVGGDGRCSCSMSKPQSCGSPPPNFTKSAHCGFMIVSRIGDIDATCSTGFDCADGAYYMKLNIRGRNARQASPDPVLQMQQKFATFRLSKLGIPDGILSTVSAVQALPADGVTQREVLVRLIDLEGNPLTTGGDLVTVKTADGQPSLATVGPVSDHGDGSYSFLLTAGTQTGTDTFVIVADSPITKPATLYPYLTVESEPVVPLHVGYSQISAGHTPRVPFVLNFPSRAGAPYLMLGSMAGTLPGSSFHGFLVPLNTPFISLIHESVDASIMPGAVGYLDDRGRADVVFAPRPMQLLSLVGMRIDWAALVGGSDVPLSSNPTGFTILP